MEQLVVNVVAVLVDCAGVFSESLIEEVATARIVQTEGKKLPLLTKKITKKLLVKEFVLTLSLINFYFCKEKLDFLKINSSIFLIFDVFLYFFGFLMYTLVNISSQWFKK